jgi:hypothetical protein
MTRNTTVGSSLRGKELCLNAPVMDGSKAFN